MTRRWLRRLTRGLIAGLLMMQITLVAHACVAGFVLPEGAVMMMAPAPSESHAALIGEAVASDSSPCSIASDPTSARLCDQHCRHDQQSDKSSSLIPPAVWLTPRYVLAPLAANSAVQRPAAATATELAAGKPPHAILHCVSRT